MRKIRRLYVIVAAAIVALVVAGVVVNYELTSTPLAHVTVTGGVVWIEQGRSVSGAGWIGPSPQNYSGSNDGYPKSFGASSRFTIEVRLLNQDTRAHSLDHVTVAPPFGIAGTTPQTPLLVDVGEDASLVVTLTAPPSSGSYAFNVTLVSLS